MERKEIIAYHAVTERPMKIGCHIIFDDEHHSGAYSRVMSKKAVVEEIYKNSASYANADFEHHTAVALRELALEEVRKHKYPLYPSRMACLYVSETLEEAEKWYDLFTSLGRPTFQIVKLKVCGRCFIGDATKCFAGTADHDKNLHMADIYWKNEIVDGHKQQIKEMLVDGDIEVIEIIKSK